MFQQCFIQNSFYSYFSVLGLTRIDSGNEELKRQKLLFQIRKNSQEGKINNKLHNTIYNGDNKNDFLLFGHDSLLLFFMRIYFIFMYYYFILSSNNGGSAVILSMFIPRNNSYLRRKSLNVKIVLVKAARRLKRD